MSYKMPGKYSSRDQSDSEDEGSVDISIDQDYHSESEYDESFREEEDEPEEEVRPKRRQSSRGLGGSGGGGSSRRKKGLPRRSKSFQEDDRRSSSRPEGSSRGGRRSSQMGDSGGGGGGGGGGRRLPRRSKTFDANRASVRMPRRETSGILDKEAIASNRARRLRAMGDGGGKDVKLMRRSSSFRTDSKRNLLGESFNNGELDESEEKKKDDHGSRRKPMRRTTSNDLSALAPEERQYARTAARGVTRSKSLKAERPNLDRASKNVAARLGKLKVSSNDAPTGLKF